jgi:hypothetical protein
LRISLFRSCCRCPGPFLAHILRSRRCSDSVCFLRVFCRVHNVVSRRTLAIPSWCQCATAV